MDQILGVCEDPIVELGNFKNSPLMGIDIWWMLRNTIERLSIRVTEGLLPKDEKVLEG